MKMSKSLIITSLLFSSMILSPSTIAGITAQAAETAAQGTRPSDEKATKEYTVSLVDKDNNPVLINEKNNVASVKVILPASTEISLDNIAIVSPDGYRIDPTQELTSDSDNNVKVKLIKTKNVAVTLKDENGKIDNSTITVDSDETKIKDTSKIKLPKGYVLWNGKNNFSISVSHTQNGDLNESIVYVTKQNFEKIKVIYMNGVSQIHVHDQLISIPEGSKHIDKSYINTPENYKLDDNNKFMVQYSVLSDDTIHHSEGYVVVNVVPSTDSASNSSDNNNPSNTNKPSTTPGSSHTSNGSSTTNMHTTTVNFVDENGTIVSSSKTTGATGEQKTVSLPDGYKLATNETNDITIGTTDNTVTVKVVKGSAEGEITSHKTVVTSTDVATLYSKEGKQLKGRALSANSNWAVDKQLVLNGTTYYRVATNEWVKANDVYEFASVNKSITTASDSAKTLYTSNGNVIKNRGLAAGSAWHTDKVATINGKQMYRVATNEWVLASDLA